jgi:DNA-binding NarL/FixJ family response regulator
VIADDHEVVRSGLRAALARSPRIRLVAEATDAESAVALAEEYCPQVVVMDLRLPDGSGLDATEQIANRLPETAVLIFTGYSERGLLARGLEAGARGYLLKEAPAATLIQAIETVARGDAYIDPALFPLLPTPETVLTPREREILQLVADGWTNAEIGLRLSIHEETVKSHVRHILRKLQAGTRTQAVATALRDSLIG